MRKLAKRITAFLIILAPLFSYAQTSITGRVMSSKDGVPVENASVVLKGKGTGTKTDATGTFTIVAKNGDVLVITSVNYLSQQVRVKDGSTLIISLTPSDATMGEVIVTAMDIKRSPRELGYSAPVVSGKEIAETQRENFLNSLQGRVAGLTITPTTGLAGASSSIVLRGFNSLSLSNQPLFIVDGIIVDNSTLNETSNGGSGLGLASDKPNRNNDYTNRIGDLNPNDIASVTILKGPEATALYGSQASSGAVVITTKKAVPGKLALTYDNSFRFQKLTRYASLNNDYSLGNNNVGNSLGPSFNYFGPAYPAGTVKYKNIDNFFRTGFGQTHNLGADFGTKNAGFHFSASYFDDHSMVRTNEFKKINLRLVNTTKINKYITITPSIQYVNSVNDKPLRGGGGFLLDLYVWPVDNDIRNYEDANGNKKLYFGNTNYNTETDNPLFMVNHDHSQDKTDRYIATLGIDINPFSWLSIAGRFGYDHYNTKGYTYYSPESSQNSKATAGYQDNYWRKYDGYNHTITATAKKSWRKFNGRLMVGTMWQDYETQMFAISGSNLIDSVNTATGMMMKGGNVITDKDLNPYDSNNTRLNTRVRLLRNVYGAWNQSIIKQIAMFGEAGINYDNKIFLNYTHRFEAASVFTQKNRKYNYPGFSLSAILSDMIPGIKGNILNYWKLRTSLAQTARLPDPYLNQSVFVNNFASAQGPAFSYGFFNNNPDLKPEKQKTYEIGTELRMIKDRVSVDLSYYNTLCTDQISQGFRASYATGYVLNTQNAASTRNQGVELSLGVDVLRQKDWGWNIRFNANHMWSKVLKLPEAIQYEYYIADTWLYGNARGGLIRNSPATTITGFHYQRNNAGNILINPANGLPVVEGTFTVIGDRNPKLTLGTTNSIRYKNWALSFLWDLKVGGDIFDATEMYLTLQGKSQRTADRFTPRVVDGVLNDGLQNSATPTKNTIVVIPGYQSTYYSSLPEEEFIQHDVNWLRLRDVTLNYFVRGNLMHKLKGFKTLSFFVTANDLILITNYAGADPAVNGNTAASNGVGAFGFDYGNLPTPMSLNFGLRAGF